MTSLAKVNPIAVAASTQGSNVVVTLSGLGSQGVAAARKALGFEVLGSDRVWHSAPIESSGTDTITVGPIPAGATAVRYLFYKAPCGQQPYQCPVYTDVAPLGALSGERESLPLGPFVMKLE